jgi:hypothetical protein
LPDTVTTCIFQCRRQIWGNVSGWLLVYKYSTTASAMDGSICCSETCIRMMRRIHFPWRHCSESSLRRAYGWDTPTLTQQGGLCLSSVSIWLSVSVCDVGSEGGAISHLLAGLHGFICTEEALIPHT